MAMLVINQMVMLSGTQVYSDATADQIAAIAEAVKRRCPVASTLASMQRSLKVGDWETFRKYPSNYV